MKQELPFKENSTLTMGTELELQLINLQTFNLAMEAGDFLRRLSTLRCPGQVKPEITQSMIEINSSIHTSYPSLLNEMQTIRQVLAKEADRTHIGICGGGAHPFQKWKAQRIFQTERFNNISEQYGYLAKQFTVFGQHIHIACKNGDDALYLCHALAQYIPHFIALSASSPFSQGVDTAFDCSRLAIISAFPLSGTPPWLLKWSDFEDYYNRMLALDIISSIKDFYWDIRPKPEFGTVELRICDTPLTVETAVQLAAFAQLLVHWLLETRPTLSHDVYLAYYINRFRASRYGLHASLIDPLHNKQINLADDILHVCEQLDTYTHLYHSKAALEKIHATASSRNNGASQLRTYYAKLQTLPDTVRLQTELWENE